MECLFLVIRKILAKLIYDTVKRVIYLSYKPILISSVIDYNVKLSNCFRIQLFFRIFLRRRKVCGTQIVKNFVLGFIKESVRPDTYRFL